MRLRTRFRAQRDGDDGRYTYTIIVVLGTLFYSIREHDSRPCVRIIIIIICYNICIRLCVHIII